MILFLNTLVDLSFLDHPDSHAKPGSLKSQESQQCDPQQSSASPLHPDSAMPITCTGVEPPHDSSTAHYVYQPASADFVPTNIAMQVRDSFASAPQQPNSANQPPMTAMPGTLTGDQLQQLTNASVISSAHQPESSNSIQTNIAMLQGESLTSIPEQPISANQPQTTEGLAEAQDDSSIASGADGASLQRGDPPVPRPRNNTGRQTRGEDDVIPEQP